MYLDIFFQECDFSVNTQDSYKRTIINMIKFLNKDVKEITSIDLSKWKMSLNHLSVSTQAQKVNTIKSYFSFLQAFDIRPDNPSIVIKTPIETEKERQKRIEKKGFLNYEDAINLIREIENDKDRAIIAVYLNTGLRVQELIDLKLQDYVDFLKYKKPIEVETKGNKYRQIVFNKTTIDLINNYLPNRKGKVENLFTTNRGNPLDRHNLNKKLKNIAKKNNLDLDLSNHMFRSTVAMYIYEQHGINEAQELLGHNSILTTRIYLKNKQQRLNGIMNQDF